MSYEGVEEAAYGGGGHFGIDTFVAVSVLMMLEVIDLNLVGKFSDKNGHICGTSDLIADSVDCLIHCSKCVDDDDDDGSWA